MERSIAIVGNGEIDAQLAPVIDSADLVMRFNDCRSAGKGGCRTDIIAVCNTGRPAKRMLEDPSWRANPLVQAASEIWCVRDPGKFAAMRVPLSRTHPDLDDFCDDYTEDFRAYARTSGKTVHVIPASTHERLDRELAAYAPPCYVVPSTGLVAIAEFLWNMCRSGDRIQLAGFGHQGWEWHPWDAERLWLAARLATRELNLAFADRPTLSAQGA